METWNSSRYADHDLPAKFVQSNVSRSAAGVIRGLHFQNPQPQGKLIFVLEGSIFDVAVDIRPDSPHYRQWAGVELSAANHRQLFVPEGFAHGFCVLGESVMLNYMCTSEYHSEYDSAIAWDDPDIGIDWPIRNGQLSRRDAAAPRLAEMDESRLPRMGL